jgi:hypothetical protein
MSNKEQKNYNFSSVDLLIYMWNKKLILIIVSLVAAVASIIVSFQITPKFKSSVIMFPTTGASVSKSLLSANYMGRQDAYGFGEEEQAEQLLQVLNSELIKERIMLKYKLMEHYEIDPSSKYPYTQLNAEYRKNISYRRTEFMSVEVEVMDRDPQMAADIANDISDLVDTVYNSMKKERAQAALKLVEYEYLEAEEIIRHMQDTVQLMGQNISASMQQSGGNANVLKALAEHGGIVLTMANRLDHETEELSKLRQRYKEARVESVQNLPHKFIVDRAYASEKKAYPKKSIIVIVSTASAFLLALILLIIVDSLNDRTATKKED